MKGIIIYATKHGCTEKAAKLLQSKLPAGTKTVNLEKGEAPDLSLYDTVILGGSIYAGKIQKSLSAYMQKNCEALQKRRLGLFLCAGEEDPAGIQKLLASSFPEELRKKAVMLDSFGGDLYWDKLDFMTKMILRIVVGVKEGYSRLSEAKIEKMAKAIAT